MNRMFESAVIKLTLWYIGVLMLVSLAFSLPVFIITSDRLERSAVMQMEILRDSPRLRGGFGSTEVLESRREAQLELDRQQLLNNIILENILILVAGTIASYLFARRTLRPIEESHAAQSRFTANASHQLRTPLATMQAEIDVALRDKKLSAAAAREVLESNLEEIARLRKLSDQLLTLTHSSGDDVGGGFDTSKMLGDFVAKYKKDYKLQYQPQKGAEKVCAKGDAVLVGEALRVLCDNARQYSRGKPVKISLVRGRSSVRIYVEDRGPGMTPGEQEHIFDRFYRGKDATRSNPSGHGLGLALAREIIERFDGSISVKSSVGKGSCFAITLPRA